MINNKCNKILSICAIIILIYMSISTGIIANDTLHTNHCHINNCSTCIFISIATDFIRNIMLIGFSILIINKYLWLICTIKRKNIKFSKLTLIDLKIIQNN